MNCHPPFTFIVLVDTYEAETAIQSAIKHGRLKCRRLGAGCFIGVFVELPEVIHEGLRADFKLRGRISWIQLSRAEETE